MLSVTNEKIIMFYKQHNYLNFEEVNMLLVDFLTNMLQNSPNNKLDENIVMRMLNQINSKCGIMETSINDVNDKQVMIEKNMSGLCKQFTDSISLQLYTIKDDYIKQLELCLSSEKTNDIKLQQDLANLNLEKILDKIQITFGDKFYETFNEKIKHFNSEIQSEFYKILNSNSTDKKLEKFEILVNEKYSQINTMLGIINTDFREEFSRIDYKEDISLIKTHFDRQKNSSNKGSDGENKLEIILNDIFPTANVVNTTGKAKSGDFIIERNDAIAIMFENKDYVTNVPICEVEKFIRDIDNLNMNGIFLSQSSGISRKEDFHIDIHNNNVIIFIHHVNYSVDKIKLAVSMLEHLKYKLDQIGNNGDVISEETLVAINKEYHFFISQRCVLLETIRKFNKDVTSQVNDISFPELAFLLANKYASTDSIPFTCKNCGKVYKNAKSLAAHNKKCKDVESNLG
jgi:hypothetical protein